MVAVVVGLHRFWLRKVSKKLVSQAKSGWVFSMVIIGKLIGTLVPSGRALIWAWMLAWLSLTGKDAGTGSGAVFSSRYAI